MKTTITLLLTLFLLIGCKSHYLVTNENQNLPLGANEGYLGFVINSLDPLNDIKIQYKNSKQYFYVGSATKGNTLVLLKLPEGEYCFAGFDVYDYRITYDDIGFCTFVEADEINYFSTFVVRNPVTTTNNNFDLFLNLLKHQFPNVCAEYIGESCKK